MRVTLAYRNSSYIHRPLKSAMELIYFFRDLSYGTYYSYVIF